MPITRRLQRTIQPAGFVQNFTQPNDTNTGVPAGTTLTPISVAGNAIISSTSQPTWVTGSGTPGDPYLVDAIDLVITGGTLVIRTGNVLVRNSKIHCSYSGTTSTAVIYCASSNVPEAWDAIRVERCEVYNDTPWYGVDGIFGQSYTIDRCNIYHVSDGCGVAVASGRSNAYVNITNNYVHDHMWVSGMYSPLAPDYTSLKNTATVVVPGGDPSKPDGSHCDGVQLQGGANVNVTGNYFQALCDDTVDGNGATIWIRESTNDLTSAAGNGISPWGTYACNAGIQFNNNQSGAPLDYVTVAYNWIGGGRYSSVNWSAGNYGTIGTYTGHSFTNNRILTTGGATVPPWSSTGQFGYNTDGSPKTGAMPQSYSPGYPISLGSGIDINQIAYNPTTNPNTIFGSGGTLAPWRVGNSIVVRNG